MKPPRLKNDCFALPSGVHWTPVDEALAQLRDRLSTSVETENLTIDKAAGRFLACDVYALRANPPAANSAVDGYGFAGPVSEGVQIMPLVGGRAAAGASFQGSVTGGAAIRILTGAQLPRGVDSVVLQEDVQIEDGNLAFHGPLKRGANARAAGEDVAANELVVRAGQRLRPAELAILAATGVHRVSVYQPLRVGVLSTGDEICSVGTMASDAQIYDANRPMLLSLIASWGFEAVDLGHVKDDPDQLRGAMNAGVGRADVILTSGGASAGDADHVSALLRETDSMSLWRIALKPGRPLALGVWNGVPVFGLPGNPVAAMVCTLIFAEPAFRVLAGAAWRKPVGYQVPAAFSKSKKPGRREYLRARLTGDGNAEVFGSEGSGRISGLSWATGLVEIEDGARSINPGDMVRYIPFTSFGLD